MIDLKCEVCERVIAQVEENLLSFVVSRRCSRHPESTARIWKTIEGIKREIDKIKKELKGKLK